MRKWLLLIGFCLLFPMYLYSQPISPYGGPISPAMSVQEEDGSPAVYSPYQIKFPNDTVTDNADGTVSVGANSVTAGSNITDNAVVRGDGGAKAVQGSTPTISDGGIISSVTDPISPQDAATKEYHDTHTGGTAFDFFLSDTADGAFSQLFSSTTGEAQSTDSVTAASATSPGTLIEDYITESGDPTFVILSEGVYKFHLHAEVDATAGRDKAKIVYELYSADSAGANQVLLITSEASTQLTTVDTEYDVHGTLDAETMIGVTDRLVLKVYAILVAETGNTDPVVTITMEGTGATTTATRISIKTSSTAFDDRYVEVAGDTMTGALTLDSTINKVTITAPASASTLTIADGKTLTVTNTANINTLTDEQICNYEATGTQINCDIAIDVSGACAASSLCGGGHGHAAADITDQHASTDITADLEEEVTEGSLADNTIISADIKDGVVTEVDLNATNTPGVGEDNYVLTYNHAGTNFTWAVDAGGAEVNALESVATSAASNEIFVGTGVDAGAYIGITACATDEKIEYTDGAPNTFTCEAISGLIDADISNTLTASLLTVADTEDATTFVGLWADATGDKAPLTDETLTYVANTGALTATTFVGALTGSSTETASNATWTTHDSYPAACSNQFVTTIGDTNTCVSVAPAYVASGAYDLGTSMEADTITEGGNAIWNATETDIIDSTHYVAGSIDLEHMSSQSVDSDNIVEATIVEADMNVDEAPADNDILTYDTTGANFSWQTPAELSLEGESHCSEHDGRSTTCATEVLNADEETYIYKAKIAFENPVATDDFVFGELTHAVTFTSIYCKTLVGTVTLDVTSGGTDIEGTDIVCDTDGQSDAGISNASGSASDEIKLAITEVASAPTYLFLQLNGTQDD